METPSVTTPCGGAARQAASALGQEVGTSVQGCISIIHLHAGACGSDHMPERISVMSLLFLFSRFHKGTRYFHTVNLLIFKQSRAVAHSTAGGKVGLKEQVLYVSWSL